MVINTPERFASYANKVCQIDSLYLSKDEIPVEPDDVQNATAIPETLKTHQVVRGITKHGVPFIKFFYLSNDKEPHFTQWYGAECGHVDNNVDENTCGFCLRTYHDSNNSGWSALSARNGFTKSVSLWNN